MMRDALFAEQGQLEYAHLWIRAGRLGLGVERFEADRRSDAVRDRVRDDFRVGWKAGVAMTPTFFAAGERRTSPLDHPTQSRAVHGAIHQLLPEGPRFAHLQGGRRRLAWRLAAGAVQMRIPR